MIRLETNPGAETDGWQSFAAEATGALIRRLGAFEASAPCESE
jgi:hypothetical protein